MADGGGFLLIAANAVWVAVSAARAGVSGHLQVALLLACAGAFAVAFATPRRARFLWPAVVVLVAAGMAVADTEGTFSAGPTDGPFGYANAKASFFLQAAIAAVIGREMSDSEVARSGWTAAAVALALVPLASRSAAAVVLLALPCAVVLAPKLEISRRKLVVAMGCACVLVLLATIALGLSGRRSTGAAEEAGYLGVIDGRRVDLWRDALALMEAHPVTGVGPGRFDDTSPVAMSDRDTRWAHNGFLQHGAETGPAGMLLLVNVFVWTFVRLYRDRGDTALIALGAASIGALAIHASVDYVLHFPAVPIAAALLAGSAVTPRGAR